jgi:hypothetical protein
MNEPLFNPPAAALGTVDWMLVRLTEARSILVDVPHHPKTLVILAARVVAGQTDNASECADAIDLLRQLDRRPLQLHAAATFANGGAA